jgi:ribosomal protein S18 acetylase RimI-like enzyme
MTYAAGVSCIRLRNPGRDNPIIYHLVKEELFPYTQRSFPKYRFRQKDIATRLRKGTTFVVRCKKGPSCGFVHLLINNQMVWIDMIAVSRRNQGKGWGKALIEKAESYGKRKGCSRASLFVDATNVTAQQFYARRGYRFNRYVPEIKCYLYVKDRL